MYIPDLSPTDKLGQLLVTIIRFQCTECFSNAINLPVSQCLNMVMFIPKVDSSDGKVENSVLYLHLTVLCSSKNTVLLRTWIQYDKSLSSL